MQHQQCSLRMENSVLQQVQHELCMQQLEAAQGMGNVV
jgi:hypothetical protein